MSMIPPPPAFDDAAAASYEAALLALAEALVGARRIDAERAGIATRDWAGSTRTWFDRNHDELAALFGHAATQALESVAAVRSARAHAAQALADHQQAVAAESARLATESQPAAAGSQP